MYCAWLLLHAIYIFGLFCTRWLRRFLNYIFFSIAFLCPFSHRSQQWRRWPFPPPSPPNLAYALLSCWIAIIIIMTRLNRILAHIFAYVGMPWESPRDEILKNKYTTLTPNRTTPLIFFKIFVVVVVVSRCPRYQDAYMHLRNSIYLRTRCVAFTCTQDNLCVSNVQEFPNNMRSNEPICAFFQSLFYMYISNHTQFTLIS